MLPTGDFVPASLRLFLMPRRQSSSRPPSASSRPPALLPALHARSSKLSSQLSMHVLSKLFSQLSVPVSSKLSSKLSMPPSQLMPYVHEAMHVGFLLHLGARGLLLLHMKPSHEAMHMGFLLHLPPSHEAMHMGFLLHMKPGTSPDYCSPRPQHWPLPPPAFVSALLSAASGLDHAPLHDRSQLLLDSPSLSWAPPAIPWIPPRIQLGLCYGLGDYQFLLGSSILWTTPHFGCTRPQATVTDRAQDYSFPTSGSSPCPLGGSWRSLADVPSAAPSLPTDHP